MLFQGTSVLSPLIPITIPMVLGFMIWMMSPSELYKHHTCLYLVSFLLIMGKISMKLVVGDYCYYINNNVYSYVTDFPENRPTRESIWVI